MDYRVAGLMTKKQNEKIRVVLCDLDGVVWLAHQPISGSVEAIARLRQSGIRVVFVTNNSFSTLEEQVTHLANIAVGAHGDIVTSAMAAASVIESSWRVLVCGGKGLIEQIRLTGAEVVVAYEAPRADGPFDAVVVGFHREFDYQVLSDAMNAVRHGARLIGSNADPVYPTPNGPIPGGGSLLAAISTASGVTPHVTGKPHEPMAHIVRTLCPDVAPSQMVMIGDLPSTDGAFARTIGCRYAFVLSGVTNSADGVECDFVGDQLSDIVDQLLSVAIND